jgi:hypothetical protein
MVNYLHVGYLADSTVEVQKPRVVAKKHKSGAVVHYYPPVHEQKHPQEQGG